MGFIFYLKVFGVSAIAGLISAITYKKITEPKATV